MLSARMERGLRKLALKAISIAVRTGLELQRETFSRHDESLFGTTLACADADCAFG